MRLCRWFWKTKKAFWLGVPSASVPLFGFILIAGTYGKILKAEDGLELPKIDQPSAQFRVPVKIAPCTINDEVVAAGVLSAQKSAQLKSEYSTFIKQIHVSIGQSVKSGQLIASVNQEYIESFLNINKRHLTFSSAEIRNAEYDIKFHEDKIERLSYLVKRGITSSADLEAAEQLLMDARDVLRQTRRSKSGIEKSISEMENQLKNANFYAPINGIVTSLIVDPRAMTGQVVTGYGAVIARIDQPGSYLVQSNVLDFQAQVLRVGMPARINLSGTDFDSGIVVSISQSSRESAVERGSEAGAESKASVPLYIVDTVFKRKGPLLPLGIPVEVKFTAESAKVSKCLPWNALKVVDGNTYINRYHSDTGWVFEKVRIGKVDRYNVELLGKFTGDETLSGTLW